MKSIELINYVKDENQKKAATKRVQNGEREILTKSLAVLLLDREITIFAFGAYPQQNNLATFKLTGFEVSEDRNTLELLSGDLHTCIYCDLDSMHFDTPTFYLGDADREVFVLDIN